MIICTCKSCHYVCRISSEDDLSKYTLVPVIPYDLTWLGSHFEGCLMELCVCARPVPAAFSYNSFSFRSFKSRTELSAHAYQKYFRNSQTLFCCYEVLEKDIPSNHELQQISKHLLPSPEGTQRHSKASKSNYPYLHVLGKKCQRHQPMEQQIRLRDERNMTQYISTQLSKYEER